jgi:hypothetical protein
MTSVRKRASTIKSTFTCVYVRSSGRCSLALHSSVCYAVDIVGDACRLEGSLEACEISALDLSLAEGARSLADMSEAKAMLKVVGCGSLQGS